jgi:ribose transport system permease protein
VKGLANFLGSEVLARRLGRLLGVLVLVMVLYGILMAMYPAARSLQNHQNLGQRLGFYGILTLGAGLLIISGGIDLSIGSVVGLGAVSFALLLEKGPLVGKPWLAVLAVLSGAGLIGLAHGLLVTKVRLQPFLVTLCGLFIYRGLAQWATTTPGGTARNVGIGGLENLEELNFLAVGRFHAIPVFLLVLLAIAAVLAVLLHVSVYGRHLFAVGGNEQAARYAGVPTDRRKILAYILCSLLAGLGGVQHMLDLETASPTNAGNWLELYAITGAVLGGCSLRGGEGSVAGMLLGAAVLPLLWNLCNFTRALTDIQFAVIGAALLLGTIVDELLKRRGKS